MKGQRWRPCCQHSYSHHPRSTWSIWGLLCGIFHQRLRVGIPTWCLISWATSSACVFGLCHLGHHLHTDRPSPTLTPSCEVLLFTEFTDFSWDIKLTGLELCLPRASKGAEVLDWGDQEVRACTGVERVDSPLCGEVSWRSESSGSGSIRGSGSKGKDVTSEGGVTWSQCFRGGAVSDHVVGVKRAGGGRTTPT